MTDSCIAGSISGFLSDSPVFRDFPIHPQLKITVILPVRNEEDNLVQALNALRLQTDKFGKRIPYKYYEVLLLANNCTDKSAVVARAYQRKFPAFALYIEEITLTPTDAHIGTVRRLLMDAAYERHMAIQKPSGVIASTDSDSEVDTLWIYHTLKEIQSGNDVIGGRILTRPERSTFRLYYLRDITYKHLVSKVEDLLDPVKNDRWPRHFQCFGASFAVTCRMYDLAGRLPVIPFLEDMALHKSLVRVDARIRMSPLVKVFTSSRTQGRVDFGLSIQLKQWGEMSECSDPLLVESAGSVIVKLRARKLIREFWSANEMPLDAAKSALLLEACRLLDLDHNWLASQTRTATYFGSLWESIEEALINQGWNSSWPAMNIVDVISQLKKEISRLSTLQQV